MYGATSSVYSLPFAFFLLPAPLVLSCHVNQESTEHLIDKQTHGIWDSPKHSSVLSVVSSFASPGFIKTFDSIRCHGLRNGFAENYPDI